MRPPPGPKNSRIDFSTKVWSLRDPNIAENIRIVFSTKVWSLRDPNIAENIRIVFSIKLWSLSAKYQVRFFYKGVVPPGPELRFSREKVLT